MPQKLIQDDLKGLGHDNISLATGIHRDAKNFLSHQDCSKILPLFFDSTQTWQLSQL